MGSRAGMMPEYPHLRVLRRMQERGLARAVISGWQAAQGEILAVMDGDLQHPPETLTRLIDALEKQGGDIAVASRHVRGGGVSEWNIVRRGISWGATLAAAWMLPGTLATVRDPMSGYFALRRSVIEGCTLKPEGYKILLEVLGRGHYRAVVEVPYVFIERQQGHSKLGPRQYREFLAHLIRLSWGTGELAVFCEVLSRWGDRASRQHGSSGVLHGGRYGIPPGLVLWLLQLPLARIFCSMNIGPLPISHVDIVGSSPACYASSDSTSFVLEELPYLCSRCGSAQVIWVSIIC